MKKISILIAEDDLDFRELLVDVLRPYASEIHEFDNGQLALDFLVTGNNSVDLIISDLKMPHINGNQFLEKIQTDLKAFLPPFVFCTGMEEGAGHGMGQGATAYLSKINISEDLPKVIREIFQIS